MIFPIFGFYGQNIIQQIIPVDTSSLYSFSSFTFTNATVIGRTGPTQAQLLGAYTGSATWTTSSANFTSSAGIQIWTVPADGQYRIKAAGAQGSDPTATKGGRGAIVEAIFTLVKGDKLSIVVGQTAPVGNATRLDKSSPGGGGTFVVASGSNATGSIYLIAGGGGGTGTGTRPTGSDANLGTSGRAGRLGGAGGTNGNGGSVPAGSGFGAGAGFLTNGGGGTTGGTAFVSGANGGIISATYAQNGGGFGGGGSVTNGLAFRYSGGGGFSGGGSSTTFGNNDGTGDTSGHWGGGGGSFIQTTATSVSSSTGLYNTSSSFNSETIFDLSSYNTGSGYVTITKL